jgi:hypothetical protein
MANPATLYVNRPISLRVTTPAGDTWTAARIATIVDPNTITVMSVTGVSLLAGALVVRPTWRPY